MPVSERTWVCVMSLEDTVGHVGYTPLGAGVLEGDPHHSLCLLRASNILALQSSEGGYGRLAAQIQKSKLVFLKPQGQHGFSQTNRYSQTGLKSWIISAGPWERKVKTNAGGTEREEAPINRWAGWLRGPMTGDRQTSQCQSTSGQAMAMGMDMGARELKGAEHLRGSPKRWLQPSFTSNPSSHMLPGLSLSECTCLVSEW